MGIVRLWRVCFIWSIKNDGPSSNVVKTQKKIQSAMDTLSAILKWSFDGCFIHLSTYLFRLKLFDRAISTPITESFLLISYIHTGIDPCSCFNVHVWTSSLHWDKLTKLTFLSSSSQTTTEISLLTITALFTNSSMSPIVSLPLPLQKSFPKHATKYSQTYDDVNMSVSRCV